MATFNTLALTNNRVMVTGKDEQGHHKTILDGGGWADLQRNEAILKAQDNFDRALADFYAPLNEALSNLETDTRVVRDPMSYITVTEGTEGTDSKDAVEIRLDKDTQILRMLHTPGQEKRLIWVDDSIEILAFEQASLDVECDCDACSAKKAEPEEDKTLPELAGMLSDLFGCDVEVVEVKHK